MSVPQADKQPSHHVVRMVYDKHSITRFFSFSVFLSIVVIFMMFYTLSVIDDQSRQIQQLSHMVNQLSFKVDEQTLSRLNAQRAENYIHNERKLKSNTKDIEHVLELHHGQLKKIYALVNKMEYQMAHQLGDIKTLLEEQKASSWQMKQVISGLKKRMQAISNTFQEIDFAGLFQKLEYLKPDFGSISEKIKGTFSDIKDKFGNMFEKGSQKADSGNENGHEQQKDEGLFSNIKNKFKRKMKSWKGDQKQQM